MKRILSLFLLLVFSFQIASPESHSLESIDTSLNRILKGLTKISASVESQALQTCNGSIENLDNAYSNWNPNGIYAHNEKVTVICKHGYRTKNKLTKQTVTCLLGNQWSSHQPCSDAICLKPVGNLDNADSDWNQGIIYSQDDVVSVTCKPDYKTQSGSTEQTIKCLSGDTWSDFELCLPVCPSPFKRYNNLCIFYDPFERIWKDAKVSCQKIKPGYNSALLMLQTLEKQEDFANFLDYNHTYIESYASVWVGAHDFFEDGEFLWLNGFKVESLDNRFYWGSGLPDNSGGKQDCLTVYARGLMDDGTCSDDKPAFCEIPL